MLWTNHLLVFVHRGNHQIKTHNDSNTCTWWCFVLIMLASWYLFLPPISTKSDFRFVTLRSNSLLVSSFAFVSASSARRSALVISWKLEVTFCNYKWNNQSVLLIRRHQNVQSWLTILAMRLDLIARPPIGVTPVLYAFLRRPPIV